MKNIPVYEIHLPEYQVDTEPNHEAVGRKVDSIIKQHFLGQNVVIRALGTCEHPDKTVDDMIGIIKNLGYDRYDPKRIGDRYDNLEGKQIDFFGIDYQVTDDSEIFHDFTHPFYHWCKDQHGQAIRLDIVIVYDRAKLHQVHFTYKGRESEGQRSDGWTFIDPKKKPNAILGIIKLTG